MPPTKFGDLLTNIFMKNNKNDKIKQGLDNLRWLIQEVEKEDKLKQEKMLKDKNFQLQGESSLLFHLKRIEELFSNS